MSKGSISASELLAQLFELGLKEEADSFSGLKVKFEAPQGTDPKFAKTIFFKVILEGKEGKTIDLTGYRIQARNVRLGIVRKPQAKVTGDPPPAPCTRIMEDEKNDIVWDGNNCNASPSVMEHVRKLELEEAKKIFNKSESNALWKLIKIYNDLSTRYIDELCKVFKKYDNLDTDAHKKEMVDQYPSVFDEIAMVIKDNNKIPKFGCFMREFFDSKEKKNVACERPLAQINFNTKDENREARKTNSDIPTKKVLDLDVVAFSVINGKAIKYNCTKNSNYMGLGGVVVPMRTELDMAEILKAPTIANISGSFVANRSASGITCRFKIDFLHFWIGDGKMRDTSYLEDDGVAELTPDQFAKIMNLSGPSNTEITSEPAIYVD